MADIDPVVIDGTTGKVIEPGTPTQVAHPARASFRTIAAYVAAGILGVVTFGPPIIEAFLEDERLPEGFRAGLATVLGVIAIVGGIVTRLMAIPGADRVLRWLKLDTGAKRERPATPEELAALEVDRTPPPPDWDGPRHAG